MSNGEQHRDAVICPKNLVKMWREYLHDYHLVGEVHAVSNVINELPLFGRHIAETGDSRPVSH